MNIACRNQYKVNCLSRFKLLNKSCPFILNVFIVFRRNGKLLFCIFDFAKVYHIVIAFYYEVNLRSFSASGSSLTSPSPDIADDAFNSESRLNLTNMLQAYSFKRKSAPIIIQWCALAAGPEMSVVSFIVLYELIME